MHGPMNIKISYNITPSRKPKELQYLYHREESLRSHTFDGQQSVSENLAKSRSLWDNVKKKT